MKPKALTFIMWAAVSCLLIFAAFGSRGMALAADSDALKYCSSSQIYQAIDKQKCDVFTQKTKIPVSVSTMASQCAVSRLLYGQCDIASTARSIYRRHIECGLRQIPFCKDPLAVISRTGCGVENLKESQVQGIFSGTITNWKEAGGNDLKITVIVPGRETAASKNFRRQLMKQQDIKYDLMTWNSTLAVAAVNYFPCGAISFTSQGAVAGNPDIRTIKIDGRLPQDPDYPYYQIFFYVIQGDSAGDAAGRFIDYTFSEAGQQLIRENGMMPIENTTFWKLKH